MDCLSHLCRFLTKQFSAQRVADADHADERSSYAAYFQRELYLIAKHRDAPSIPMIRFNSPPASINELLGHCEEGVLVWIDDQETLVLIYFHEFSLQITKKKCFEMTIHFDEEIKISVRIYGASVDRILEQLLFFGRLPVAENTEMIGVTFRFRNVTFNDRHEDQLALLLDAIPTSNITFVDGSRVNSIFSEILATRPGPIQLTFDDRATMDSGEFLDHLRDRLESDETTIFGSLFLGDVPVEDDDLEWIVDHLHLFESLQVGRLQNDQLLQLLAAPMGRIGFAIDGRNEGVDLSNTAIVAKDISISMQSNNAFPTNCMLSLLHRVGELGHLESLELDFWGSSSVPVEVRNALLRAMLYNKQLKELILYDRYITSNTKDHFASLANHEGLRILRLRRYPFSLDPEYAWLKQLLQRNRLLQAFCMYNHDGEFERVANKAYALNRFYLGSESLKNGQTSIRSSLLSAALTHNAACVERIWILLMHHMDILCGLLHERGTVVLDGAEVDAMEVDEDN